jgi:hypothetical protein
VPTRPAATKAQFTGHPAEIMRGLAKGEEHAAIDVGASSGFAFELEGKSGRIEAYRLDDGSVALVAPPRAWWREHHGDHAGEIDALFAEVLGRRASSRPSTCGSRRSVPRATSQPPCRAVARSRSAMATATAMVG